MISITLKSEDTTKHFTIEQIKKHNKKDDFWAIFRNKVYDLTDFWKKHPGGDIILEGAGKDMTYLFDDIGHSLDAESLLKQYYIGELEKSKL
ncbi:cytochrome b5 C [Dictyostelium discoideum AX4]|uniref:Cytochrome b5 C n=1 Tax=Dictyostelium discoideum TaxID=44689 RepID=Q54XT7_DICDI|nr:cytochrome b5 C [Dictyostelium discoideum AX4]EAL67978.2 cytochrome b5 C [Dictyostelium discoideum AX4]|eukprot:XP_641915.2 cytochrome b5 C [Dictyostelium discoideum AX4]